MHTCRPILVLLGGEPWCMLKNACGAVRCLRVFIVPAAEHIH